MSLAVTTPAKGSAAGVFCWSLMIRPATLRSHLYVVRTVRIDRRGRRAEVEQGGAPSLGDALVQEACLVAAIEGGRLVLGFVAVLGEHQGDGQIATAGKQGPGIIGRLVDRSRGKVGRASSDADDGVSGTAEDGRARGV